MKNKPISARIAQLDPVQDHQEIMYLLGAHSFYWDVERALEFALFRTYAVPSISGLLARTGEFKNRPRKRYDDTELILAEILENGYDSERAQRAFARMNAMHQRFRIANEDYLYVLSTFIFVPIDWMERFGWRPFTEAEKLSIFLYYREVGIRMHIQDIPTSLVEFHDFHVAFEEKYFRNTPANREIADYTIQLLLSFYMPTWLHGLGRPVVRAMMDDRLLGAMGMEPAPTWLVKTITGILNGRAWILRQLPEPNCPHLITQRYRPTYPEGYRIEELGTFEKDGK